MTVELELDDLQGNILQGYGHRYCAYVNLHIDDADDGRALLSELRERVTDAQPWRYGKPAATLNLAVSFVGLKRLEVPGHVLSGFPYEFREGMAARAVELGDVEQSAPACWQPGLQAGEIHVMAIIHAHSEARRDEELHRLRERVARFAGVEAREPERGYVGDSPQHAREHFGLADGFGQPAIDGQTGPEFPGQGVPVGGWRRGWPPRVRRGWRMLAPGEFVLGYEDEDGVKPAAPAAPYGQNGTFMVFRKLHQNVARFRALVAELAREHFNGDRRLATAKLVGRWPDGTPVMRSPEAPIPRLAGDKRWTNDFRYSGDANGFTCPIGAHIRRANPRDSLYNGGDRTRRHRIIRRGMPYGDPLPEGDADDKADRGLLFVCLNASTARQFEVVNSWLTRGGVFGLQHGDLLTDRTGEPAITIEGDPPIWFRPSGDDDPLITTRGGEYLFVPSLRALAELGNAKAGP